MVRQADEAEQQQQAIHARVKQYEHESEQLRRDRGSRVLGSLLQMSRMRALGKAMVQWRSVVMDDKASDSV